ncbi:MAG: hypothetical protein LBD60_02250 [Puniceicoccales bacterium]|jgi:hypothetical protein|nr:hypothetical protein [Puniceicoccales bacterium]
MFLDSSISIFIAFGTKIPLPCLQCPGGKEFAVFFRYQILSNLANVNTEGGNVNIPLYAAVETWNPDMVRLLLEQKGIDINVPQNTRMSWDDYERIGYGEGDFRPTDPKREVYVPHYSESRVARRGHFRKLPGDLSFVDGEP